MSPRALPALLALMLLPGPVAAQQSAVSLSMPAREFTLPNGLRVVVHEDHSTPIVSVNVWYHVGSKNERAGRAGFAHLFEHLMFEGSKNVPEGAFDEWLEAAGASNNGTTSNDRTSYYEDGPVSALELMLYLEADRMGWLPDAMTQEKLDGQRDVVKNERRQNYENRPYGLAFERMFEALYPEGHPYQHTPIGTMDDLNAASLQDVIDFFRTYYAPNNATLAVAGAVRFDRVRELVTRYFSDIPRGPAVPPVEAPPAALAAPEHVVMEDNVQLPRVYRAWHSPAFYQAGDAEMDVLASVLANGKASRLYSKLVYERQIAQDVSAFQASGQLGSQFVIVATARPGVPLDSLNQVIDAELRAIADRGVQQSELERALNKIETSFVDGLQHVGGFGGKADRLNSYVFYTGRPDYVEEDLARYRRLTPAALQASARRFLIERPGVTLSVVPRGKPELAVTRPRS